MNLEEYQVALREDIESQIKELIDYSKFSDAIIGPVVSKTITDLGFESARDLRIIKIKDLLEWENFLFNRGEEKNSYLQETHKAIDEGFFYLGSEQVIKGPNLWLSPIPKYNP